MFGRRKRTERHARSAGRAEGEAVATIDDESFFASTEGGFTVVDFWAPWCGPCRAFGPVFDYVAARFGEGFRFARCNVDESPVTADLLQVTTVPTVIAFSPDGSELGSLASHGVATSSRRSPSSSVAPGTKKARSADGSAAQAHTVAVSPERSTVAAGPIQIRGGAMPKEVGLEEMRGLVDKGAQVVEVLPKREYDEEHLPGALNIPLKTLDEATAAQLDRDRPVVVYCWDYF